MWDSSACKSAPRGLQLLLILTTLPLLAGTGVAVASDQATVQGLQVEWAFNTSDVFEGRLFGPGRQSCQTVWDVDGDGVNEVVFGTRRGESDRVWCIDQDGSFEWVYPPIEEDGLPGSSCPSPGGVEGCM